MKLWWAKNFIQLLSAWERGITCTHGSPLAFDRNRLFILYCIRSFTLVTWFVSWSPLYGDTRCFKPSHNSQNPAWLVVSPTKAQRLPPWWENILGESLLHRHLESNHQNNLNSLSCRQPWNWVAWFGRMLLFSLFLAKIVVQFSYCWRYYGRDISLHTLTWFVINQSAMRCQPFSRILLTAAMVAFSFFVFLEIICLNSMKSFCCKGTEKGCTLFWTAFCRCESVWICVRPHGLLINGVYSSLLWISLPARTLWNCFSLDSFVRLIPVRC